MKLRDRALGCGIIRVMHAWLATTVDWEKTKNKHCVCCHSNHLSPPARFQKSRDKWWFTAAVISLEIRAAIFTNLSLSRSLIRRCEQDHRGFLHDSDADCWEVCEALRRRLWLTSSFTKYKYAPEYTRPGCKHCSCDEENPVSMVQTGLCPTNNSLKWL